jgi:formate--tetrahydrofolate ligase
MPPFLSDIAIAQQATPRRITDVAADLGLGPDDLDLYGRFKAKLPLEVADRPARGRLVLVTAVSPTPAGEGKTTVSVGLAQALRRLGTNAVLCVREPSLGPVFGMKGGATGGGRSQVLPMEDINLHFTGDFHAIASAHALLAALIDNHLHQGTPLADAAADAGAPAGGAARYLDARRVTWPRTIDMNDRALRQAVVGMGGLGNGTPRETRWVIVPASEVMAVLALAGDLPDLERRLGDIVVGATAARTPVRARDLGAAGAMTLLLRDAFRPNLVQTLEGGPALVHCGPFGNIAHGCNSLVATRAALALGDVVVTEAGFGSDLGAEKFFDIKCRAGGLAPAAAVLVATVRALKWQGGARKEALDQEDLGALERGLPHLAHHVANVRAFGPPVVVAVNRRTSDTDAELRLLLDACAALGVPAATADIWAHGGAGGEALARLVLDAAAAPPPPVVPAYDVNLPIRAKVDAIVRRVYGGDGADFAPAAARQADWLEANGMGATPVCMAKTQYSFTDDPTVLGRPTGFRLTITELWGAAGAGFVVARAGDVMTMPGLPKEPAAARMGVDARGTAFGLA